MNFRSFEFHDPWVLLLLLPAAALVVWSRRRPRRAAAIVFPSVSRLQGLRPTWRQRAIFLIPLAQILAVLFLVVAGARPRQGDTRSIVRSQGIAIQMILDRSGSMEQKMRFAGQERPRIDIVKQAFLEFVAGTEAAGRLLESGSAAAGKDLQGRKTDLIGLTTFARFTEESCPLVSTHEPLITTVKNLTTVTPWLDEYDQITRDQRRARKLNTMNATAIGDGLYRAVLSLVTAEEDLARGEEEGGYKIKGKVAIVLTDGENNAGRDPVEAGRYAAANGIRVYYIVFREPVEYRETIFGMQAVRELSVDEMLDEPRRVVEESGGKAFLAQTGDELRQIYSEIDKLERSEIGRIEFRSFHEKYHWFLIPAVVWIFLAFLLDETLLRRMP